MQILLNTSTTELVSPNLCEVHILPTFVKSFCRRIKRCCCCTVCWNPSLSILSAIGQEHEVLLRDKLKERNLSFLGKPSLDLLNTFLKTHWAWRWCCACYLPLIWSCYQIFLDVYTATYNWYVKNRSFKSGKWKALRRLLYNCRS